MDETEVKHVIEAALLAAGKPLSLDRLAELFAARDSAPDRAILRRALDALAADYEGRGIELKEVASGYRVQVKRSMSDWLNPLWEERAPRYTRALLETLALIAYRQPITRAEIEEVRGVVVSTNIIRTLLERSWIRVVGHRDVPGKPAMFGTTKDFLDYFGMKKLEDLPTLADIKDATPQLSPQTDLIDTLEASAVATLEVDEVDSGIPVDSADGSNDFDHADEAPEPQGEESAGAVEVIEAVGFEVIVEEGGLSDTDDETEMAADNVIPLRVANAGADGAD